MVGAAGLSREVRGKGWWLWGALRGAQPGPLPCVWGAGAGPGSSHLPAGSKGSLG